MFTYTYSKNIENIHLEMKTIIEMIKTMTKIDFKTKNSVSKMKWFSQKLQTFSLDKADDESCRPNTGYPKKIKIYKTRN